MKAAIRYRVEWRPNAWSTDAKSRGGSAWFLVKEVVPEVGPRTVEPVAIFNLDSEAELFMAHVYASGLDGTLVTIHDDSRALCEMQAERKRRGGTR